ncbi:ATP-binding protein [Phycicoccus sp.]|uniref:ATP-binding protein n=1 Tax=Phycicoccus sp. TaxID=1902410 RepID=UPI002BF1B15A|nr:ATP-binding protein [Phycicoccus sp.]HMM94030.1 ATP-binding protein [Phycicoccus sp.]
MAIFKNPYRPGAGHMPPHLAGRETEYAEFDRLLRQEEILENLVLTGLRGVGKTVLLETFKPRAIAAGWLWCGTDLSESASVSERNLAERILTDLAVITSGLTVRITDAPGVGFGSEATERDVPITYDVLRRVFDNTPGLTSDKLKSVLRFAADYLIAGETPRVIFAYDEAQNLADNAGKEEFPLSMLLDVFAGLQRSGISFLLVLTGLPTLFPKLVEARTYAERMFRVIMLGRLSEGESEDAIKKPLDVADCPVRFTELSVRAIANEAGGYPYFIQFICREVFDAVLQQSDPERPQPIPIGAIQRKLDTDFFAGRWARATDRQRELLYLISGLEQCDEEFTIQEVVAASKQADIKEFSASHVNQMLAALAGQGLVYKNRFGKYSLAVPLLSQFIQRVYSDA